mgnify:FL=1|tara:strand:- start:169 stop:633 length:465 start_codon:yes stop_codon:yes gene_type:complete
MELKVKANTLQATRFLKKISRKQSIAAMRGLNRVSNMAVQMITTRTQSGKLPDGKTMEPYTKATKKARKKAGRQIGFVDLTDTGKMFRSLDFKQQGLKNTLFFSNIERAKIAAQHDFFGVGKRNTKRPFFSIGRDEEEKLKNEFAQFYFREIGL